MLLETDWKKAGSFLLFVNPNWRYLASSILLGLFLSRMLLAEDDPIHDKCMSQKDNPGPWCYREEVKAISDPDLCGNRGMCKLDVCK